MQGVASEVRVFEWAEAPPKGDAADHPAMISRNRKDVRELLDAMAASPIYSSATSTLGADKRILTFRTAKEVAEATPQATEWLVFPWVAKGAITEIDGKIKAAGKTTFTSHMVRSAVSGEPFLGEPTKSTKVMYLTEQSPTSFRKVLERAGLTKCEDLFVLFWHEVIDWMWPEVVRLAADKALQRAPKILIL